MGPHLIFHPAGGVAGINHFQRQFAAPMAGWWETLGNSTLTPELQKRLAKGIAGVIEQSVASTTAMVVSRTK
jgi:carnitine 3-dehydrogenase